jgi:hypothetical protein
LSSRDRRDHLYTRVVCQCSRNTGEEEEEEEAEEEHGKGKEVASGFELVSEIQHRSTRQQH